MLHEQVAVQMLDLMAEGPGRQALGLRLEPVAVPVLRPDPHPVGPGDNAPLAGDAEAALQPGLLAALGDDLRVDELQIFLRFLVQHQTDPAQDPHLGCRQSRAVGVCQRLRHIVQQVMQPPVKFCHRAADLCQTLVALFYDLS